MNTSKITCPNCSHQFDVEQALAGSIESKYKEEYEKKIQQQWAIFHKKNEESQKSLETQLQELQKNKEAFQLAKAKENELFHERMKREKEKIKIESLKKSEEAVALKLKALTDENREQKEKNKLLQQKELEFLEKTQKLKEKEEDLELQLKKQLLQKQQEIEQKAREKERKNQSLKMEEYKKQLEDQKKLIEEMKRKSEQGSMQLQGEVQEIVLQELLDATFPFDRTEEVGKGIRGADVIQTVVNSAQQVCGKIVYESKRTQNFNQDWINKLKDDQRLAQADVAVLVTETLPKDIKRFTQINGVWVCHFSEIKEVAFVIRHFLIQIQTVGASQENKGDKMELLYNFLLGTEFQQNVTAIVEGFTTMKEQLDREKRAMQKIWKEREKQIEKVVLNTTEMYGSIKGIAGNSIGTVDLLELPE